MNRGDELTENESTDEGNGLKNKYRDEGVAREMRVLLRKNMVPEQQDGIDDNTYAEKSRSLVHSPSLCTERQEQGGGENRGVTREWQNQF